MPALSPSRVALILTVASLEILTLPIEPASVAAVSLVRKIVQASHDTCPCGPTTKLPRLRMYSPSWRRTFPLSVILAKHPGLSAVSAPESALIVTFGQPVLGTSGGSVSSSGSDWATPCARTIEFWIAPLSSMPPNATMDVDWRVDDPSACNAALADELVATPHSICTFEFGRMTTPLSSTEPRAKAQYRPFWTTLAVASAVMIGGWLMNIDVNVIRAGT